MQDTQILTRQEWFKFVEEYKNSSLTQTEFCKQKNISLCRFGYYVKKCRDKIETSPSSKQPSFSQINIQSDVSKKAPEVRIELINGFKCHVPVNIHPDQLKMLLRTLLAC